MRVRRSLPALIGAVTLALGMSLTATASAAPSSPTAVKNPCGFYETGSDAYYNHCTNDGSRIVIEIDDWGPNSTMCVGPGVTWIGEAGDVDGAWYVGRTC
ncbi:Secreted protein OS=Streptomyces alboniger OX=132473 GN=CP975_17085 PE=4 SV=1 [Streptomyces alboniger]